MAELNFSVSDRLVIDGTNGISIDNPADFDSIPLTTPISVMGGKAHKFVDGETFLGILSNKNIKNVDITTAGVNSIEVAYLVSGFYYWVIADGALAVGDKVEATGKGFKKTTDDTKCVGIAVSVGVDGGAVRIRGGK